MFENLSPILNPFPPGADVVDILPASRRPLLQALRQRAADSAALWHPLADKVNDLRPQKHALETRLKQIMVPRGAGGPGLTEDDVQVIDVRQKIAQVAAEMSRLGELIEARSARAGNVAALLRQIEDWLRSGRPSGTAITAHDDIAAADVLKRGEAIEAAIERHRLRLREHDADRHRVESAPYPSADAKAKMRDAVAALAERGAPGIDALVEFGREVEWPMTTRRLDVRGHVAAQGEARLVAFAHGEEPDLLAMFCWLNHAAVVAKLGGLIDESADDQNALAPKDRAERLATIAQDKLTTERQLCALIWKAQAGGGLIEFPTDADPRAVLGLELIAGQAEREQPYGQAAAAISQTITVR